MEEVHVDSSTYIKPDFDKKVRVVLAPPGHIRRTGIKMTPHHLISAGGGVLSPQLPERINGAFLNRIDDATDPEIIDSGIPRRIASG